ncbi:MAG TPA: exosortase/archaeosortase family protein [Puia sp.]|jgi:exosortase/archaeosortase family protein|nr:exosortase/archaeosortase family protein [Puia sp.]
MILSDKWNQVPKPVKAFLLKAITVFVVWKAVYLLFLLPGRVLDKPLTYVIGKGTAASLNLISRPADYTATSTIHAKEFGNEGTEPVMAIRRGRDTVLSIADPCNGLELLVLYAGLIFCLPADRRRKLAYILGGIFLIEVINVIRCTGLVLVYLDRPQYLGFSHHYLFTFVVYAFIFGLWWLFSRDRDFAKKLELNAPPR